MKEQLNILLLGRGGRESALAARLLESPRTALLHTAPARTENAIHADLSPLDFDGVADYAEANMIDMVIVGPEAPIVGGLSDILRDRGIKVIAPDASAARLEGSKEFAKEFMSRHAIPTPRFMTVTAETVEEGSAFLDSLAGPYVVKANGLASGKGVFITDSLDQAKIKMHDMLEGLFASSSETVVIEEFRHGTEFSVILALDGEDYIILPVAHDYKRIGVGDTGPNTAGMGAVSSPLFEKPEFIELVEKTIIRPTLRGFREEGIDYNGFLYLGIIESDGLPMLLEYNVRLGDPETQAILPRLKSDIVDLLEGIADRTLAIKRIDVSDESTAAVVVAAPGYPGPVQKGEFIEGLYDPSPALTIYPGSVTYDIEGRPVSDGARVATAVAIAPTIEEAALRATASAQKIQFPGCLFRTDIGARFLGTDI